MNIISYIIQKFLNNNKLKTISITVISLLINCLKINVISYIIANIIESVNVKNEIKTNEYFKYFIIVSLIYIIIYTFYKILQNDLLSNLKQDIKTDLIDILLKNNNENMANINFTKLNTPIFRISYSIFYFFNNLFTQIIPNITLILIMFIYFFYKIRILGLFFIIGNLLIIIYIALAYNSIFNLNQEYEETLDRNDSYIVEILNNIDKIIFRGHKNNIQDNLNIYSNNTINKAISFYSSAIFHSIFINLLIFLTIFVCILYLIKKFYKNEISVTYFITFLTMLLLYRDLILSTISQVPDVIELIGRCSKVIEKYKTANINYIQDIYYNPINLKYDEIIFNNVNFSYKQSDKTNKPNKSNKSNKSKNILNNFSIKINIASSLNSSLNKIIGITGISGKGKSTCMKLLIKAYDYYEGEIYIDNVNIKTLDPTIIRQNIIYVNQNTKLFDDTISYNIMYGCKDKEQCELYMNEIMQFKKIKELLSNIELNNKVGLGGEKLSGGQRQIINIINGLITPSKITILDEPTNALDIELKNDVISLIQYFKKYKKCIIIITHDKDLYEIFDEEIQI